MLNADEETHLQYVISVIYAFENDYSPGQPGRLMEGKGTVWNNVFLPRATSNQGNYPLSGDKRAAWTPHALKEA